LQDDAATLRGHLKIAQERRRRPFGCAHPHLATHGLEPDQHLAIHGHRAADIDVSRHVHRK
jgi:hypothetical protein